MPTYVVENPGQRLDAFLAERSGESRAFVQRQIADGKVSVGHKKTIKAGYRVQRGENVRAEFNFVIPPKVEAIPGDLEILHEDEHLLLLNKPQGIVVHPAETVNDNTLVHHLLHYLRDETLFGKRSDDRPGIVHRLDRGTSGALLVAKNRHSQTKLSELFKDRMIEKHYEAICFGSPTLLSGSWDAPIGRDRRHRKKMSTRSVKSRSALTHWECTWRHPHFSHFNLFPKSGRTHQLRVHLSQAGFPIIGDPLYGRRNPPAIDLPELFAPYLQAPYPFLHAKKISFNHPISGKTLSVTAPRPANFTKLLTLLKSLIQ